jgi:hypothetical protein
VELRESRILTAGNFFPGVVRGSLCGGGGAPVCMYTACAHLNECEVCCRS